MSEVNGYVPHPDALARQAMLDALRKKAERKAARAADNAESPGGGPTDSPHIRIGREPS